MSTSQAVMAVTARYEIIALLIAVRAICLNSEMEVYKSVLEGPGPSYLNLPGIKQSPVKMIQEGNNISLKCEVVNMALNYTVSWIRLSDIQILTVDRFVFSSDPRMNVNVKAGDSNGSGTWTLRINKVTVQDSGTYQCQVNTEPSSTFDVRIHVVPVPVNKSESEATELKVITDASTSNDGISIDTENNAAEVNEIKNIITERSKEESNVRNINPTDDSKIEDTVEFVSIKANHNANDKQNQNHIWNEDEITSNERETEDLHLDKNFVNVSDDTSEKIKEYLNSDELERDSMSKNSTANESVVFEYKPYYEEIEEENVTENEDENMFHEYEDEIDVYANDSYETYEELQNKRKYIYHFESNEDRQVKNNSTKAVLDDDNIDLNSFGIDLTELMKKSNNRRTPHQSYDEQNIPEGAGTDIFFRGGGKDEDDVLLIPLLSLLCVALLLLILGLIGLFWGKRQESSMRHLKHKSRTGFSRSRSSSVYGMQFGGQNQGRDLDLESVEEDDIYHQLRSKDEPLIQVLYPSPHAARTRNQTVQCFAGVHPHNYTGRRGRFNHNQELVTHQDRASRETYLASAETLSGISQLPTDTAVHFEKNKNPRSKQENLQNEGDSIEDVLEILENLDSTLNRELRQLDGEDETQKHKKRPRNPFEDWSE